MTVKKTNMTKENEQKQKLTKEELRDKKRI